MSETWMASIVGGAISLITTVINIIVIAILEYRKKHFEKIQMEQKMKRDNLTKVYTELIKIVNAFPDQSPNDALKYTECSLNYCMESFDSNVKILEFQIIDYREKLDSDKYDFEKMGKIEYEIMKREYAKQQIKAIKKQYYEAKERYKAFCDSDKAIFDLYAGQEVKNELVEFEVIIHNVFISGRLAGDKSDTLNNIIDKSRTNLVYSMRQDVGSL